MDIISNAENQENQVLLKTSKGDVVIQLFPEKAPQHAERIRELTTRGFYDGLTFHRVINDFVAQTGDPTGTGAGGSYLPDMKAEFNDIPHKRGIVSMARAASNDSANSQFFIVTKDSPHLNGQYSAFGEVISGMDIVDQIKQGDKILKMELVAEKNIELPVMSHTQKILDEQQKIIQLQHQGRY